MSATTKKLLDGVVAGAAIRDGKGKRIDTQYAKASDLTTLSGTVSTLNGAVVKKTDVVDNLTSNTVTNKPLSAKQGAVLKGLIDNINSLLASDDTTLDELQEVVTYIKNNKSLIDGITTSKVNVSDIVDNLTSEVANKPLSAKQGYVLKGLVDGLSSSLNSLSGTVSGHTTSISNLSGDLTSEVARAQGAEEDLEDLIGGVSDRVAVVERASISLDSTVNNTHPNSTTVGVTVQGIYNYFAARGLTTVSDMQVSDWEE